MKTKGFILEIPSSTSSDSNCEATHAVIEMTDGQVKQLMDAKQVLIDNFDHSTQISNIILKTDGFACQPMMLVFDDAVSMEADEVESEGLISISIHRLGIFYQHTLNDVGEKIDLPFVSFYEIDSLPFISESEWLSAEFVSQWEDGSTVRTDCKINPQTGRLLIESSDESPDCELIEEYVVDEQGNTYTVYANLANDYYLAPSLVSLAKTNADRAKEENDSEFQMS